MENIRNAFDRAVLAGLSAPRCRDEFAKWEAKQFATEDVKSAKCYATRYSGDQRRKIAVSPWRSSSSFARCAVSESA
jgi:hypothetical protein